MIEEAIVELFVVVFNEYVIVRSGTTSIASFSGGSFRVESGSDFKRDSLFYTVVKLLVSNDIPNSG